MRYPHVLLDVGGTLAGPRSSFGAVYSRVFASHGLALPAAAFDRGLAAAWREMDDAVPRGADRYAHFPDGEEGYWRRFVAAALAHALGEPDAALARRALPDLRDAFADPAAWRVFDDVVPALTTLRRAGVRLAVVSNWDSRLPRLLDDLGLSAHLDAIVVSCREGREKPDPALFLTALARIGGRAATALHVGDRPDLDGIGARAAGVDAVLVDRSGARAGSIRDFGALPAIVAGG